MFRYSVSPVSVPKFVWECLKALQAAGVSLTIWHEVVDKAVELEHGEAALWIKPNTEKYFDGLKRGFEFEGNIIETTDFVL